MCRVQQIRYQCGCYDEPQQPFWCENRVCFDAFTGKELPATLISMLEIGCNVGKLRCTIPNPAKCASCTQKEYEARQHEIGQYRRSQEAAHSREAYGWQVQKTEMTRIAIHTQRGEIAQRQAYETARVNRDDVLRSEAAAAEMEELSLEEMTDERVRARLREMENRAKIRAQTLIRERQEWERQECEDMERTNVMMKKIRGNETWSETRRRETWRNRGEDVTNPRMMKFLGRPW